MTGRARRLLEADMEKMVEALDKSWTSIRCQDVEWDAVTGIYGAPLRILTRLSREPKGTFPDDRAGLWKNWTLGDLANVGEREWRGIPGVGDTTVEAIKLTIDAAAAGVDVTKSPHAYEPRPWSEA